MSRSNYVEDYDHMNLYRATVERAIRGKRGQAFLVELAQALDSMSEKRLISGELVTERGEVCAIGSVCKARGLNTSNVDTHDPDEVGSLVGIARSMAAEIAFENDEVCSSQSPEERWSRMRKWVDSQLSNSMGGSR